MTVLLLRRFEVQKKSSSEMMKQNRTKHQNANKTHNPKYVLQGFEQRKGLNVDYTQH